MSERLIDVTWTRKGAWFVTTPCGVGVEFPGEIPEGLVRQYCWKHKRRCHRCAGSRLSVETATGYREINQREKTA
jgi:hypothetical protein